MSSRIDQPYGVKVLVEGTDPVVDLVTVHGLDGHRERTWTAKNQVSWLRDYLPKVVPNARILVYGYDGRTRSSEPLSCQKLHDHAISLVTDLTLHRTVTKTTKRPIIFIAHSIGGIIVKDALIHSNSANKSNLEHHNAIKTSTYGILFFGTPHQGSDILTLTRTLMDTASRKKANHDIFKNLEKGSELLQKQIGQYNHISSHFVTKCFYEAYKSSFGKGTTVPPDSAVVPGATNVETFPIYSNHEDMVMYESMDNDGFKRVSSCLQVMVEGAVERVTDNWQRSERVKAAESNGMQITFNIPFEPEYPKNQHFTGRQGLLDKLHQTIEEAQSTLVTVVLCGIGGVGKTQIASEYTHTYQKEYQSIFWINAATKESMELGFRTVAQRLIREHAKIAHATDPNYSLIAKNLDMIGAVDENGSIYPQEDYTDCIIRGVKMWLAKERNENWLLVIDNADDLEDMALETFIPAAAHGTIIITSRRTNWGSFKTMLEVEVMQEQEGKLLLLKSAGLEEDPIAEDVVTKLGSLPLAIVQAGAYILIHQMPLKRYLEIYEESFNTIFGEPPSKANWHYENRTVRTTWEISFKAIANTNKQAAELLSLCSFISNENIYDDMLRRGKQLQKNDITLDTALGLLFSYSLAQRKELNDSFYIHPVVHLWAHMRLGESEWVQKTKEAVGMIYNVICVSEVKTTGDLRDETRILPHLVAIGKNVVKYLKAGSIDQKLGMKINSTGLILIERGLHEGAERLLLQVLEAMQSTLGKEHPNTLTSMNNLASTYRNQGRYKETEVLELQVLEARQSTLGKEHPNTLTSMNNLASTYWNQGRHKEAEVLQLQVLEVMQRILGNEHPNTLSAMSNLQIIRCSSNNESIEYISAETEEEMMFQRAVAMSLQQDNSNECSDGEEHPPDDDPNAFTIIDDLATALGQNHPETLQATQDLAATYWKQGRLREVAVLELRLVDSMQSTLGEDHSYTLNAISNLVQTYIKQGRLSKAEELQLQVVEKCSVSKA